MPYPIRLLRPADIPRLSEINPTFTAQTCLKIKRVGEPPWQGWEIREETRPQPFDKGPAYDFDRIEQENIRQRLLAGNGLFEIVEDPQTQRLVGILDMVQENWRRTAWIWNLMLDIEVRGQGLGRMLFERACNWAKMRHLRAILLETQSNNPHACHFYARLGFKLVGVNDVYYTNHDLQDDEVALFWSYPLE